MLPNSGHYHHHAKTYRMNLPQGWSSCGRTFNCIPLALEPKHHTSKDGSTPRHRVNWSRSVPHFHLGKSIAHRNRTSKRSTPAAGWRERLKKTVQTPTHSTESEGSTVQALDLPPLSRGPKWQHAGPLPHRGCEFRNHEDFFTRFDGDAMGAAAKLSAASFHVIFGFLVWGTGGSETPLLLSAHDALVSAWPYQLSSIHRR